MSYITDLFKLIAGSAFLGSKLSADTKQTKRASDRNDDYTKRCQDLHKKYKSSFTMERECARYIALCNNHNSILDRFSADFREVYGDGWESKVKLSAHYDKRYGYELLNDSYWVLQLMLAQEGKVSTDFMWHGIQLSGDPAKREVDVRYLKLLERQLAISTGTNDLCFVMELERRAGQVAGEHRSPNDLAGAKVKIAGTTAFPTVRIW